MTKLITVLTDGFADWETSLLNAVAHSFYGVQTAYATPGGRPVVSAGGLQVMGDVGLEHIDLSDVDALIICGGTAWQSDLPPDIAALVREARQRGKVVAAICDATVALARAGLLDDVAHTSNGTGYLDHTGYLGQALYRNVASAVSDQGIVTAPGTAPVSFMAEVMRSIGLGDENLAYYVGLHAAQFQAAA